MIALGPLVFAAPLALIALIALPVLWLVLRATPPAPREVIFAPIRLLQRLALTPETPRDAPWWLIALRLLMAALIILALARPMLMPEPADKTGAPLLIIADDGWAGAAAWLRIAAQARTRLEGARADARPAAILFTAPSARDREAVRFGAAQRALEQLETHTPQAWPEDRADAAERLLAGLSEPGAPQRIETVWLSSGLAGEGDAALARASSSHGPLRVLLPPSEESPLGLLSVEAEADGFAVSIARADTRGPRPVAVTALAHDGQALARASGVMEDGHSTLRLEARLPLDLRNRIAAVRIDGAASAGAVQLLGGRWSRPRAGLLAPESGADGAQPLLSDLHYIRGAMANSAELVTGGVDDVLDSEPSILVMVDSARSTDERIAEFVEEGGLLIRFAGPRLAARGDSLLPVTIREGGRLFGGAMAWDEPQAIAAFDDDSPFAGLLVPSEARVNRQVLAEPGPELDARVWARLDDGTPLVTAERRGRGWIILFHVTAGPDWSSLPLSGLFPAMLDRILPLADGREAPAPSGGAWRLEAMLDGSGALTDARSDVAPASAENITRLRAGPELPPGLWTLGSSSAALNVLGPGDRLEPFARNLPGAVMETRGRTREVRLAGPLLGLALFLLAADTLIALALSGRLPRMRRRSAGAALGLAAVALAFTTLPPGFAQDETALANALEVRLAYVRTGDARIDAISRAGLVNLSRESTRRSAVEPADPTAIDIETDELLFFPMIYWPVTPEAPALSTEAAGRVSAYIQSGGLIVFDTRDGLSGADRRSPHPGLVRTLESIDVPPLARMSSDHVLSRTFYLLREFPGRYAGSEVWVEADPDGSSRDGASGVVIGSADWAAAWAVDASGQAMAPVEGGPRQREMAVRFGVNLAMYALTGNYKDDQVHVPAILQRLGRE